MSRLHIGSAEEVTIESSPTRTLLIFQQNADPWMRGQRKAIPLQGPGPLLKREHQAESGPSGLKKFVTSARPLSDHFAG
jgi:hypothetical protein